MRIVALSLLFLWTLTLAGCQSKAAKVKKLQDQYNAEYPAYAKACLEEDNAGATRLLTGEKLTTEQMAALEAKKKERDARCKRFCNCPDFYGFRRANNFLVVYVKHFRNQRKINMQTITGFFLDMISLLCLHSHPACF